MFNDEKNYSYWEGKKETQDEIEILSFLNTRKYSASLGKILHIGIGNSFIAKNVIIGKKSYIGKNVVIYPNCILGNNVKILDNSVIGCYGLGYLKRHQQNKKLKALLKLLKILTY